MRRYGFPAIRRRRPEILQVNLGYRCNQSCVHCHVNAGPNRTEEMSQETVAEVLASLPCYSSENVDRQRGKGVFEASIRGLRRLNALGYGRAGGGLVVNLVYNPQGPSLPPAQAGLELDYKRELKANFGVEFNRLYTLANMPIQRFGSMLI